jgi:hypothetical protein
MQAEVAYTAALVEARDARQAYRIAREEARNATVQSFLFARVLEADVDVATKYEACGIAILNWEAAWAAYERDVEASANSVATAPSRVATAIAACDAALTWYYPQGRPTIQGTLAEGE